MLSWMLALSIGLLTGILSGFGIGGGTILMIYLTALASFPRENRSGHQSALLHPYRHCRALLLHSKNHQLEWEAVLPAALCGCATAAGFSLLAMGMDASAASCRLFGIFLLFTGISELKKKPK